jgi:hypothetical protein
MTIVVVKSPGSVSSWFDKLLCRPSMRGVSLRGTSYDTTPSHHGLRRRGDPSGEVG